MIDSVSIDPAFVAHIRKAGYPLYRVDREELAHEYDEYEELDWWGGQWPTHLWSKTEMTEALADPDTVVLADLGRIASWYSGDGYPMSWGKLASFETLSRMAHAYRVRSTDRDRRIVIDVARFATAENMGLMRQILARSEYGPVSPYVPLNETDAVARTWEYLRDALVEPGTEATGWWLAEDDDLVSEINSAGLTIGLPALIDLALARMNPWAVTVNWDEALPQIDGTWVTAAIQAAIKHATSL